MDQLRVVLHVSENDRFQTALKNIKHLLEEKQEMVTIALVLNAEPVKFATTEKELTKLSEQGVEVNVCQHSLNNFEIKKADLVDGVNVVKGGALELIYKQYAGWAYLKP